MKFPEIHIKNSSFSYEDKAIFSSINLTLSPGRWVGLLGTSGIGKSSLLRMIAGLKTPNATYSGEIYADNQVSVAKQIAYMAQKRKW